MLSTRPRIACKGTLSRRRYLNSLVRTCQAAQGYLTLQDPDPHGRWGFPKLPMMSQGHMTSPNTKTPAKTHEPQHRVSGNKDGSRSMGSMPSMLI
jgi:hypothetical protein